MEEYLDTGAIKHDEIPQDPNKIPVFLKVLCILTFVGAGLGILGGLYNVLTFQNTLRSLEMLSDNPFGGMFADYNEYIAVFKEWGMLSLILNLLGAGLCLAGALVMWKLKKIGYYIYVLGQILPFISAYVVMKGIMPSMGPFAGWAMFIQVVGFMFPLAFIVMYTVNFKHLK